MLWTGKSTVKLSKLEERWNNVRKYMIYLLVLLFRMYLNLIVFGGSL